VPASVGAIGAVFTILLLVDLVRDRRR
jgi:hypothetical protein